MVVIGSGFGGSVTALRLAEKGYSVAVLEAGRRFADDEFPKTSWDAKHFLWAPALRCFGVQRLTLLRNVLVLSGSGVGGGSLIYANTLYRPLEQFYDDPQWRDIADWRTELAPFYDQAERMLGVSVYHRMTRADVAIKAVAERMGVGDTFHQTPVGVYFGRSGVDPYFGGAGPLRHGCEHCGACMTGCRVGAKNTLVKNYLHLAERLGAEVHQLTTVASVRPDDGGYRIDTRGTGRRRDRRTFHAGQVVFAAGALGTQELLLRMRADGHLPAISATAGTLTRTNSESIVGARSLRKDVDFTDGVAITSSFHPDAHTHIEPVRYGPGSNAMGLLQTVLTDGGPWRPLRWFGAFFRHPIRHTRVLSVRRWSHKTVIALVMQSLDNSSTSGCAAAGPAGASSPRRRATASRTRPGSRPATRPSGCSPRRSAACPAAAGPRSSTSRSPPTSSAARRSVTRRSAGSWTPTTACTATPGCTSSTARRSAPTSASTRR
ncbi:hypothetical protein GCM10027610_111320 [Dactylosporangium cerinum]